MDLVPSRLPRPVLGHVTPAGLQPGRRHPFLAAFEHLVSEPDQHLRRPLGSQPQHPHLSQAVSLPRPVRPSLPGLHQGPVSSPMLKLTLIHDS
jgi:hypothetical protein